MRIQIISAAALLLWADIALAGTTYDATLKGKSCNEGTNQQMDCDYKIGSDFWLSIAGVGQSDAGVTFMKSDFNGYYYGSYGVLHRCVIVKPGRANKAPPIDVAFISPQNGKVYSSWAECRAAQ